jgi:glutathione S-transferase
MATKKRGDGSEIPKHWYPDCPRQRAKINEYLDWHHLFLRQAHGSYFFRKYASPMMGKPIPFEMIEEAIQMIDRSLDKMENYWLS